MAVERGYRPLEPLTARKNRWLLRHILCGKDRHSNLATVRKTEPVCPHCRWTTWAAEVRETTLPRFADAAVAAWRTGDDQTALELIEVFADRYVWPAERIKAVFDSADAELLVEPVDGDGLDPSPWRCRRCGYITAHPAERMMGEARASWLVCHQCDQRRLHHDPAPLRRYYLVRGLDLLSPTARDRGEAYDARCTRCGTLRRVSVNTLASGAPPCLPCDGRHLDPDAPHRVYLVEFTYLDAYKIGITTAASDDRLSKHIAEGGTLLETIEVPDRATAALIERIVLDRYRQHPADVEPHHLPQGGWTECWNITAGYPSLHEIASHLASTPR